MFTDIVVNLDGNTHFGGYTGPGNFAAFPFPSLDFVVEASRGNMENAGIAPNVHTDIQVANACQPGYQAAYSNLAYGKLQPKTTIEASIVGFMTKLSQTADCHFGFVGFNNRAGTSPSDTDTAQSVSYAYPVAGQTTYLMPQVVLPAVNQAPNTNLSTITSLLTPPSTPAATTLFLPNGGSNVAAGLQQAYNQLTGANVRPGAQKAILLVTDKVPTRDLAGNGYPTPATNGPALADAMTVAGNCASKGIPIFCVGTPQSGDMLNAMLTQYSDNSTTPGLVATAGNGGTLNLSQWTNPNATAAALTGNLNNVIRQLLTLVRG